MIPHKHIYYYSRLMAIQGGTMWVEEMQHILTEEGHGGRMFELHNPAD
jgi:hypothetical protein